MENTAANVTPSSNMAGFQMPKNEAEAPSLSDPIEETVDSSAGKVSLTGEQLFLQKIEGKTHEEIKKIADDMTYKERIESFDMTLAEASEIVDKLVSKGEYEEEFNLSKNVKVVLGTRDTKFNSYLSKIIDAESPRKSGRINQLMTEYQLAGSLVSYNGEPLPVLHTALTDVQWEEMIDVRLNFVMQLQGPIFLAICNRQAKFDAKMLLVFSKGYDENF